MGNTLPSKTLTVITDAFTTHREATTNIMFDHMFTKASAQLEVTVTTKLPGWLPLIYMKYCDIGTSPEG